MRSSNHGSSVQPPPLDNAFSPTYLSHLRERDDSLTAAEAELAGPWKIEPVPGRPGAVAILRIWEDLAAGDPPVGVLWHLETARLLSVLLPAIDASRFSISQKSRRPPGGNRSRLRAGRALGEGALPSSEETPRKGRKEVRIHLGELGRCKPELPPAFRIPRTAGQG